MATALASLASGKAVHRDVAMTGEITFARQSAPDWRIEGKGACSATALGLKTVIVPKRNEVDLDDVPDEILEDIEFVFVDTVADVLQAALEDKQTKPKKKSKPKKKRAATKAKAKPRPKAKKKAPSGKKSEPQEPVGAPS